MVMTKDVLEKVKSLHGINYIFHDGMCRLEYNGYMVQFKLYKSYSSTIKIIGLIKKHFYQKHRLHFNMRDVAELFKNGIEHYKEENIEWL
jgi:hypothetical protein